MLNTLIICASHSQLRKLIMSFETENLEECNKEFAIGRFQNLKH
jgi:hypothetical protein